MIGKESMLGRLRKLAAASVIKNAIGYGPSSYDDTGAYVPRETTDTDRSNDNSRSTVTTSTEASSSNNPASTPEETPNSSVAIKPTRVSTIKSNRHPSATLREFRTDTFESDAGPYGGLSGEDAFELRLEDVANNFNRYRDQLPTWAKKYYKRAKDEFSGTGTPLRISALTDLNFPFSSVGNAGFINTINEMILDDWYLKDIVEFSELPRIGNASQFPRRSIDPNIIFNIPNPLNVSEYRSPFSDLTGREPLFYNRSPANTFRVIQHEGLHSLSNNLKVKPHILGMTDGGDLTITEPWYSINPEYSLDDGLSPRHGFMIDEIMPIWSEILDTFRASDFAQNDPKAARALLNSPDGVGWVFNNVPTWAGEGAIPNIPISDDWLWLQEKYPKVFRKQVLYPGTLLTENNQQSPTSNDLGWA